jgi:PEGA domain
VLAALAGAPDVRAQDVPDPSAPDDPAEAPAPIATAPPAPLARVAVAILPAHADDKPLTTTRLATVQVSMEHALAADARLDIVDLDEGLADSGGVVPKEAIAEARALVASGLELLHRNQPRPALLKLEGAATQLAGTLAWAQKQELAQAQFLRGAAHAALGEDRAAESEFIALLTWRPDFTADPTIAPARVLPLWDKARARARRLPGGAVDVTSQPSGAMAYIDGRFVGFTPTTIEALAAGTHYLTVRARRFLKAVVPVRISDKKVTTAAVALTASPRAEALDADLAALRGDLGAVQAPAGMQGTLGDISELVGVDQVVVLLAPASGAAPPVYHAYVYGAVGGMRLADAQIEVGADESLDDALGRLAVALYAQVSFAPPPAPPPPRRERPRPHTAFYRRWWFWSGVGVIVLGLAAGAIIVHERDRGPACPGGDSCGVVVFAF